MENHSKLLLSTTVVSVLFSITMLAMLVESNEKFEESQSNLLVVANSDYNRQLEIHKLKSHLHEFWKQEFELLSNQDKQMIKEQIINQKWV